MQVPAFQCGGKRDRAGRNPVQAAGFRKQMGPEPLPPDGFGAMSGLVQSVPRMAGYLCQSRYRAWRIESPLLAFEAKKNSPKAALKQYVDYQRSCILLINFDYKNMQNIIIAITIVNKPVPNANKNFW